MNPNPKAHSCLDLFFTLQMEQKGFEGTAERPEQIYGSLTFNTVGGKEADVAGL